jgi:two-component system, NarL family, nitrate/nitrite response regulator NarL
MMSGKESTLEEIAICDTQAITIEGLRSILAQTEDLSLVDGVSTLDAATRMLRIAQPAVLIIDKTFGIQTVLEWMNSIRAIRGNTALVVWGISLTEPEALRYLQSGAKGILRKGADVPSLLACLRAVLSGSNWMEDAVFRGPARHERAPHAELTPREGQVMELVEQGLKNKEIAGELGIRPGTVKIHLKHIFEKTGVRGRYGLALSGMSERSTVALPYA